MDARRKNDLAQLARAVELYYADHGAYPNQLNLAIRDDVTGEVIPWGNAWQPYIDLLPKDPSGKKRYIYYTSSDRQMFWIHTSLDRRDDPAACPTVGGNNGECPNAQGQCSITGVVETGSACNYGVTSPNTVM